jgi:hypothetical protein
MCQQQSRGCYCIHDSFIQYRDELVVSEGRFRSSFRTIVTVVLFEFFEHFRNQLGQTFSTDRGDFQNLRQIDRFQRIR